MFMYHVGICLMIWMLVGFLMGLKVVYYDRKYTKENLEKANSKLIESAEDEFQEELFEKFTYVMTKSKLNFIIFYTIMGVFPLVIDIYKTFKSDNTK